MINIILVILAVLYVLSPYDIVPDMLVGWGWLDDLAILGFLWRYFYLKKRKKYAYQQQYRKTEYADRGETLKDPYTILEVDRNATAEEIKKAYRRLVNKYHPDKVVHLGEEFKKLAEKHFKEVQEAYQTIKDRS
ncbi:MAG: DnaJ domain-containing protein [Desulfobacterales bacterium]|nr:DnaJ domain-containing protein [Desulfobacterales bacterium]HJO62305.1 DnaJ domain-containing protein [Desulfobacterales bacterium]